ncbi:hypothetical protein A2U01_0042098 [Trifolium medium]|uniref:Uncharacterized protein n=1 Tax=Trifolium medium TaxID=97028 RepID=A0A392Q9W5_9FABA|nr:hypothetical protein [Trifolium medium]
MPSGYSSLLKVIECSSLFQGCSVSSFGASVLAFVFFLRSGSPSMMVATKGLFPGSHSSSLLSSSLLLIAFIHLFGDGSLFGDSLLLVYLLEESYFILS